MRHHLRKMTCLSFIAACLAMNGSAEFRAQPPSLPQPGPTKNGQPATPKIEHPLFSSLRDVINQGATLFNEKGDHAGCYRVFQGALIAVRPFLAEKPDLLNHVDKSL